MSDKGAGGAGYSKLRKPDNSLNQTSQYWGGLASRELSQLRNIQQNELAAQRRLDRERKKEIKDWEKQYNLKEGDFLTENTGFDNTDAIMDDFSRHTVNEYLKHHDLAQQALRNNDLDTKYKHESMMMKLKNGFKEVSGILPKLEERNKELIKLSTEGKISGVDSDYEKTMEQIGRNNVAIRWKDGKLVYTGITLNDDGKSNKPFEITHVDFVNDNYSPIEKLNYTKMVTDHLKNLGKITQDVNNGMYVRTEQKWGKDQEKSTKVYTESIVMDDRNMADLYYQLIDNNSNKKLGFTDQERKQVSDKLYDMIKGGYDEKTSSKFNSGLSAHQRGWANINDRRKRQEEKDKGVSEKEKPYSIRKYDVNQVIDNKDVEAFKSGDFKWKGKHYASKGAEIVNDKLVITSDKGKKISINLEHRAVNDLFDAFEGQQKAFDKVMSADEHAYREERVGTAISTDDILNEFYDNNGNPTVDDEDMINKLRGYFKLDIDDNFTWDGNSLTINGRKVNTRDRDEMRRTIDAAQGQISRRDFEEKLAKTNMTEEQFRKLLEERNIKILN